MRRLFCDKCGKLIDVEKGTPIYPVRHYNEFGYDMCERCHNAFVIDQGKFVKEFFQPVKYEKIT